MSVMPATLEGAIARHAEHQVDSDPGRHHSAHERAALAAQVFLQPALGVTIQRDADVVLGAVGMTVVAAIEPPVKVQDVADRAGHAAPSAGWPKRSASWS